MDSFSPAGTDRDGRGFTCRITAENCHATCENQEDKEPQRNPTADSHEGNPAVYVAYRFPKKNSGYGSFRLRGLASENGSLKRPVRQITVMNSLPHSKIPESSMHNAHPGIFEFPNRRRKDSSEQCHL